MTTSAGRRVRGKHRLSRSQWAGSLVAVAASLAALSLPGTARADTTGYDQMTGVGDTASAVDNISWTQGILDNNNQPITSANADRTDKSSPLWFMYQEFQNLQVSVSQTQNLGQQGITVKWKNGTQTSESGVAQGNYLQMMECWGDATTGPTPEQCEYGSSDLLPGESITGIGDAANARIGDRVGDLCTTGAKASTSNPPSSANGDSAFWGCDPGETGGDSTHIAPCPGPLCAPGGFTIPFSPVTDPSATGLDYGAGSNDTQNYSQFNTNEVQLAVTGKDGTGQQQFETLTGVQAPGLGCGQADNGSPRGCWLVIVPRGTYEPNGFQANLSSGGYLNTSPLSASNWAQRIQIHLGYNPVGSFCPIGTQERPTFGTQMVARAMQSWQLELNQQANCTKVYGYSAVFESTSTQNLQAGGDSGLAFTTIPIGSEAAREGLSPPTNLPTILYAPVAITAVDFGFNINLASGYDTTPVELTPLLLAKALTQSYRTDLPDYYEPPTFPGPSWAKTSPNNISQDPTFQKLNPGTAVPFGLPLAPLLTEDHSAENQQIWQWIQGSTTATSWLGGTPDANDGNMVIDPDYKALNLGTTATADSFSRAYTGNLHVCEPGDNPPSTATTCPDASQQIKTKTSIDLLPYTENYDSAAAAVLTGNNPDLATWDTNATAPDGTKGYWDKNSPQPIGQRFIWAADDTSDLAAFGLIPAQLCDDAAGDTASNCVSPTTAAVTIAVGSATADSSGLLHVNPASPGSGGYPLTQIIYAAVPTNQSAAALDDYANLISFAAGTGQTTGSAPGNLPPGYLPLPSNLQTKAQSVVAQLRALASPSPSPSTSSPSSASSSSQSPATTATTTTPGTTPAGTSTTAGTAGTAGPTPAPGAAAAPTSAGQATSPASALGKNTTTSSTHPTATSSSSTVPAGGIGYLPPAEAAAGATPKEPLGAIRWALIVAAGAGGVFAVGGTLLRSGGIPQLWSRRRRLEWLE